MPCTAPSPGRSAAAGNKHWRGHNSSTRPAPRPLRVHRVRPVGPTEQEASRANLHVDCASSRSRALRTTSPASCPTRCLPSLPATSQTRRPLPNHLQGPLRHAPTTAPIPRPARRATTPLELQTTPRQPRRDRTAAPGRPTPDAARGLTSRRAACNKRGGVPPQELTGGRPAAPRARCAVWRPSWRAPASPCAARSPVSAT